MIIRGFLFFLIYFLPWVIRAQVLVFTGTFDMPHDGHREILFQAMERVKPKHIFVNPGPTDHKPRASPLPLRMKMTEMAFFDIPGVKFPPLEVSELFWEKRDNQAIEKLIAMYPGEDIYRVVGWDRLMWETADSIRESPYKFLVSQRGTELAFSNEMGELIGERILILPTPKLILSSTAMRIEIEAGFRPDSINREVFEIYTKSRRGGRAFCFQVFK